MASGFIAIQASTASLFRLPIRFNTDTEMLFRFICIHGATSARTFMPTLTDGVLFGLAILVLDFLAWRFMDHKSDLIRLAFRALMFGLSSYVLFGYGMNPFRAAPWPDEPLRHLLAQVLEII
jgi:hypothetical protein